MEERIINTEKLSTPFIDSFAINRMNLWLDENNKERF